MHALQAMQAMFPIRSVLTELGLFNKHFDHFGSVLSLFYVRNAYFYPHLDTNRLLKSCTEWF